MASHPNGQHPPKLGATFVPGGFDDYYLPAPPPELVSPSPQRITPEVPENIQNNLASLELEGDSGARQPRHSQSAQIETFSPPSQPQSQPQPHASSQQPTPGLAISEQPPKIQLPLDFDKPADMPHFSPFPPITPRPNVPPSDEEKEQILENARLPVLNSNDAEMQLAWAQDVLAYVATAQLYEERIAINQPKRPATPEVEHQLRADAMNVVTFLAEQHHPKAEFMRGMWLEFGNFGVRQDKREAFRAYKRAADNGYFRSEYRMGMQFEQNNDPVKALIHYQRGAEAGDSASNYRLGMMTIMGQMGQQQDFAKGIQMLRLASDSADENAPQGAYVLGMLQARELPQVTAPEALLPYDERAARINIEKAAYLGFAKAQLKMGAAYELCSLGCEFDPALSLHYNSLAARQGEAEAEMAISKWFLCGYEGVFQKNEELAYVYAERAAHSGLATAEFAMGYFNEIGMYVPVNIEKAREWYEKAARAGNQDAIGRIEGLNQQNTLSKKDHENVAINRIRSQYGSKRGARPDRFKAQAPALPVVTDEPEEYGRGSRPNSQGNGHQPYGATPYPDADGPGPVQRTGSAAPYPLDNGPPGPRQPGPTGGFFAPEGRASSTGPPGNNHYRQHSAGGSPAFNINPNSYDQGPQRPATSVNEFRERQGLQQQRVGSVPGGYGHYQQGQRPAPPDFGFSAPEQRMNSASPQHRPQQQGMHDIGFVAPLNPRKSSPMQSPHQNPNAGQYPSGNYDRPPRGDSRPGGSLPPTPRPIRGGPGGMGPGPGRGGRGGPSPGASSAASSPGLGRGAAGSGPGPKPQAPAAKPPGSGPKTFEQMGIPAQQKEGDCIIM